MLTNYIKTAVRSLVKNKFYSAINVFGLAVGFVCAILILLYIDDELSYDKHHEKHERIYRLESRITSSTSLIKAPWLPHPLSPALKDEYPEIAEYVRFLPAPTRGRYKEKVFDETRAYCADETVFDVFSHRFIKGSPKTALENPGDIVLTKRLADKYFGDEDPVGKIIRTREGYELKVTAVIEDLPDNSHLKYDALIAMAGIPLVYGAERFYSRDSETFWRLGIFMHHYVLLHENADIKNVIEDFDRFEKKYYAPVGRLSDSYVKLVATPLAGTHFAADLADDYPTGNILYIYIFATVAVLILLVAAINYMNMATAHATKRAKEIGIRKAIGAHKGQIAAQSLTEAVIMSLAAMALSILLAELLLPYFNSISAKELSLLASGNADIYIIVLSIAISVGFISGSYPAFYLSRFNGVSILKEDAAGSYGSAMFRKLLVILQFTVAVVMVIGALLVAEQLNYLQGKDPGFDRHNVMAIPVQDNLKYDSLDTLKTELLKSPLVEAVSRSTGIMGSGIRRYGFIIQKDGRNDGVILSNMDVDKDYFRLMGIDIKEGRDFAVTVPRQGTTAQFIVNEAFVRRFGYENGVLGEPMQLVAGSIGRENTKGAIIGVVKDFNFGSLHDAIEPFVFMHGPWGGFVNIRITPGKIAEAIRFVKKTRSATGIDSPMEYYFIDDIMSGYYSYEERLDRVFGSFSLICIFIACIGLMGLSAFIAKQRTKEIGIRKAMGASVTGLAVLLSRHYIKLAAISTAIAWPIAYYAMTKWLEQYPYRIEIGILPFLAAGVLAVLIVILTVGYLAIRAASANPIESLRYE